MDDYARYASKFMIVSKLSGKVLDIEGASPLEGAKVIMFDRKYGDNANQLWYIDRDGFIRAYINQMSFYSPYEGQPLRTSSTNDPRAKWRIEGDTIRNGYGQCLDIIGGNYSSMAEVCAYQWNGNSNQRWNIQHV